MLAYILHSGCIFTLVRQIREECIDDLTTRRSGIKGVAIHNGIASEFVKVAVLVFLMTRDVVQRQRTHALAIKAFQFARLAHAIVIRINHRRSFAYTSSSSVI